MNVEKSDVIRPALEYSQPTRRAIVRQLVRSRWGWGGLTFLIVGSVAAFTVPGPLTSLLAILGLIVCAATVAGEVMLARDVRSADVRLSK